MTNHEVATQGSLLALRSTLSYLVAKVCQPEGGSAISELHGILTQHLEGSIGSIREETSPGGALNALDSLETSAIKELDAIFSGAAGILRRHS